MATKKTSKSKKGRTKKSEEVVMWLRLPQSMKVEDLKKLGVKEAACFGGDTCIAATTMRPDVGLVVEGDLKDSLKKAGLSRRADPCFGGDTCIV